MRVTLESPGADPEFCQPDSQVSTGDQIHQEDFEIVPDVGTATTQLFVSLALLAGPGEG